MSKFTSLPTDNAKTGPSEDSIFYRSQSTITDQYKTARIEQQQKQQRLLSNISRPNSHNTNTHHKNKARTKLKPVKRIALGNKNRHTKNTKLTTNKPATHIQSQLLRNYKAEHSRQQFDTFKKQDLPPGTQKCSLFKKSLGCNRAYIGHFVGSKGPRFPKSKIRAIREDDLQTQLERVQYDKSLNAKKREEIIAKLKFGLDNDEDKRHIHNTREWHFEFTETPNTNSNQTPNNSEMGMGLKWLGKPKQKKKENYSYVLMEWTGTTRTATVYPATFIEFGLEKQLIADGQASAESAEKRHRAQLSKWRKKQAQRSMMEKLGGLFGHDKDGNVKARKRRLRADEITPEARGKLREMYIDKANVTNEEREMLRDLLGEDEYNEFMEQYTALHSEKTETLQHNKESLIEGKKLSQRLRSVKRRGQLEELCDFDEFMSDDEDENNLNDWDLIDDEEQDVMEEREGNASEDEAGFKKLVGSIGGDLANKEYALPEKVVKGGGVWGDGDSDDEDGEEVLWSISDDDEEDCDINDGNVKIKGKKNGKSKGKGVKRKLEGKNGKNGPSKKKRKLSESEEKKLKEELDILVRKILKKFNDGLEMLELWRKITATLSYEPSQIKNVLPPILKNLAKQREINGKKKYCLKDKYKK